MSTINGLVSTFILPLQRMGGKLQLATPNPPTITILIQLNRATVSPRREPIGYICDLGARFGCERGSEHSNRRD